MKNRSVLLFFFCFLCGTAAKAEDTVFVRESRIPILTERQDNILFYLRLNAAEKQTLDNVVLKFGEETGLSDIQEVKLYYSGTEASGKIKENGFAPVSYLTNFTPGKTMKAHSSYSVLKDSKKAGSREIVLNGKQKLFPGVNYFWVSIRMKPKTPLSRKITATVSSVGIDGKNAILETVSPGGITHRMGTGVRHAGDDGISAFRIPGLVTTNKGTLLGVYDVRYNNSKDLQEHIDIGLSRSTDGGKNWEKMRIPISFGEYDGLPTAQNGAGDPAILVDTKTNTVWIIAVWTHGMGNQATFFNSQQGMDIKHTGQLVLSKSTDDGKTWSAPVNITGQVKDPSWYFLLQGPGRGITTSDGTLVFPIQYVDSTRTPNAAIMYSKDRGETWKTHNYARTNTTEAQVVETEPGVLMLNMRDNRGGSRAVAVTTNLGKTWTEHVSSRKALQEPVCMASLIAVKAEDNVLGRDILIFSNPNTKKGRHDMTVKVSLDKGITWLPEHQLLLDEDESWGYSCLTMIDKETIGILYESSVAQMTFQAIRLKDIVK